MTLDDAADYIILKTTEGGVSLNLLKLQKLVYYSQAWHLALYERPLFNGRFQAWVHGPVSRELYDRYKATKSLYSPVTSEDIRSGFNPDQLTDEGKHHIDEVLEVYAKYSGSQLEDLTHRETPWIQARKGFPPSARCENEIDENVMKTYYASQIGTD